MLLARAGHGVDATADVFMPHLPGGLELEVLFDGKMQRVCGGFHAGGLCAGLGRWQALVKAKFSLVRGVRGA